MLSRIEQNIVAANTEMNQLPKDSRNKRKFYQILIENIVRRYVRDEKLRAEVLAAEPGDRYFDIAVKIKNAVGLGGGMDHVAPIAQGERRGRFGPIARLPAVRDFHVLMFIR